MDTSANCTHWFRSPLCALFIALSPVPALASGAPELITLDMPAGGYVNASSISGDGRHVAFVYSFNPTPSTFRRDVYVHDRQTNSKKLVSRGANGEAANGHNLNPVISTDGRFVAFQSLASNLVPGNTRGIYLYDLANETIEWIANGNSAFGISADGRYLVYADDLYKPQSSTIIGATLYMIDRVAGSTERLNVPPTLRAGGQFSVSDDGRFVSYVATRRMGDEGDGVDAFVLDRSTGTSTPVNVKADGSTDFGTQMTQVSMSSDGRYVAFTYSGEQLVPDDTNKSWDVFVRDRHAETTERVSVFSDGAQSTASSQMGRISADGRHVVFAGPENLDRSSDVGGAGLFVRDLVAKTTRRAAVSGIAGYAAAWPSISADGQFVSYDSVAPDYPNGHIAVAAFPIAPEEAPPMEHAPLPEMPPPTVTPPGTPGAAWTAPAVPVSGTAAPGETVTLTANNLTTGETFTLDGVAGPDGTWNVSLSGLTDGVYALLPQAGGRTGDSVSLIVDRHAPVSTLVVTPAPNAHGWYGAAIKVGVSAIDGVGGQGVQRIDYTLDGGAVTVLPANGISLAVDGNHQFCYRAVDLANNAEILRCATLGIDTTAPAVTPVFDADAGTLSITAHDALSGVGQIETSLDGQRWTSYAAPLGFTRDGSHTVHYRVRDMAGNVSIGQTSVLVVTAPVMTAAADQSAAEGGHANFSLGAFSDRNQDSPWTADIDWGDGSAHERITLAATGAIGTLPHSYANSGTYIVVVTVSDSAGSASSKTFKTNVNNAAPTAVLEVAASVNEGGSTQLMMSSPFDASSADAQAGLRYAFSCHGASLADTTFASSGTSGAITCNYPDGPGAVTVRARIFDQDGGFSEYSATIALRNLAPALGSVKTGAAPVEVNATSMISVPFGDAGIADTHTAVIDWGDGNISTAEVSERQGAGTASGSHAYAQPGIYAVTISVTDKDGATASTRYESIVVIEPADGTIAGKGSFASVAGGMPGQSAAAGTANLQIKSDYKKRELIGSLSFDLPSGNLRFDGNALEWMVINGERATVRGTGTINGAGSYSIEVTVIDGGSARKSPDLVRVRIWDAASKVIYDNLPGATANASPTTQLSEGTFHIR